MPLSEWARAWQTASLGQWFAIRPGRHSPVVRDPTQHREKWMPLSEEEQRVLDEIERHFDDTDRSYHADGFRSSGHALAFARGRGLAVGLVVAGFALVCVGTPIHLLLGVAGYLATIVGGVAFLDASPSSRRQSRLRRLVDGYLVGTATRRAGRRTTPTSGTTDPRVRRVNWDGDERRDPNRRGRSTP